VNQKTLLKETRRILKPRGRAVISDVFLITHKLNSNQRELITALKQGFIVPNVIHIKRFISWLKNLGFENIEVVNVTKDTLPLAEYMARHASLRLEQNQGADEVITRSRKACIATYSLS